MLCQHCINFPGIAQGKSWANIEQKDKILWNMNYKTTKYLCMKDVLDSNELQMLRRADYMRECNILRVTCLELGGNWVCRESALLSICNLMESFVTHELCLYHRIFLKVDSLFQHPLFTILFILIPFALALLTSTDLQLCAVKKAF